uniref:Uncharacterized protein n=1 Tax=virus sp. ct1Hk25 TaxID=2825803 RepID=A0A8S5RP44_9VIRU|nr:MAG TPA: hypothetical protein [virus sp. ct1Hk25]
MIELARALPRNSCISARTFVSSDSLLIAE